MAASFTPTESPLRAVLGIVAAGMLVLTIPLAFARTTPPFALSVRKAASGPLIDINTATPEQLKALSGMGDAYVRRIIGGRPYTAKNQLATRGILPQAAYEKIAPLIVAHRVAK